MNSRFGFLSILLFWASVGFGQDNGYAALMNEAVAAGTTLRSAGKLPGVPADSTGSLMLRNVPAPNAKLIFPLSITLEVTVPGAASPLAFFLTKQDANTSWHLTESPVTPNVKEPALREELLRRMERDQAVRKDWHTRNTDPAYMAEMAAVDQANTTWLKGVIAQHGWPGTSLVGPEGARAAFLIVQHADLDRPFQRETLPLLQAAYHAGQAAGQEYALLLDRVRVGEDRPQVYGSQTKLAPDGTKWIAYPIEDEAQVDQRRREMGMEPLADYLARLNQLNPISPK